MLLDMRALRLYLFRLELFRSDHGFLWQHHGNVVAHRIDAAARATFQARAIGEQFHRRFANGTNENVEEFLRNGHVRLRHG